jgi:hypothetical protein
MESKKRILKRFGVFWIALFILGVSVVPAHAALVGVDQVICDTTATPGCTGLSGTVDVSATAGGQLQIIVTNTSASASGSNAFLTGIGFQMVANISGGTATPSGGSTFFNPDSANLNDEWAYANPPISSGHFSLGGTGGITFAVDHVLSALQADGNTTLSGTNIPPANIDGPPFGIICNSCTVGGGQAYVQNQITFLLNVGGLAAAQAAATSIAGGNVVLAFASPVGGTNVIPEPSTYALYALGISMLLMSGWWQKRRKQQGDLTAF